jgi:general nucleoside transport system permease protein
VSDELKEEEFEEQPPARVPSPQENIGKPKLGFVKGVLPSLLTVLLAFLVSGIAIAAIGKDPVKVYRAIFDGTGLVWFFQFGSYSIHIPFTTTHIWFWWNTSSSSTAAGNLQQTLITTTPIILTALAVALPFRAGMFNIGGQGQYFVGSYFAVWIGSSLAGLNGPVHMTMAIVAAILAGAAWAGIAGILKATVGAHEVISTIMLNWIAIWVGAWLLGQQGPLQGPQKSIPVSANIVDNVKLPIFWGPPLLQGLSIGIFIAVAMLFVYSLIINRSTLGYEIRAVGFNPDAARYGGMSVARNYFLAMAIAGAFAGLAGAIDVLGWRYQLGQLDVLNSSGQVGFIGLAAALLGRNTALGVGASSLLFGALLTGTSGRQLDPSIFRPDLAGNLTTIIQGLVILFVGLNLAALPVWWRNRRARRAA